MPYFRELLFPNLLAIEVVAEHPGRTVPHDHLRAVGNGCGPAVGVRSVRGFSSGKLDRPHPKFLARPAVEAVQVSLLSFVFRASDEDAPARNDGAAIARSRQRRF